MRSAVKDKEDAPERPVLLCGIICENEAQFQRLAHAIRTNNSRFEVRAILINSVDDWRRAGHKERNGYRRISILGNRYGSHEIAWAMHYGKWAKGEIDHLNGIRSDNRILNLRDVPRRINLLNNYLHRKGKLPGIRKVFNRDLYSARITVRGRSIHLGCAKTEKEAFQLFLDGYRRYFPAEFKLFVNHSHQKLIR